MNGVEKVFIVRLYSIKETAYGADLVVHEYVDTKYKSKEKINIYISKKCHPILLKKMFTLRNYNNKEIRKDVNCSEKPERSFLGYILYIKYSYNEIN